MAKKKDKKQISNIVSFVQAVLGIVAIIMIFIPAISIKDTKTTYTGLQIAFGYKESTLLGEVVTFNFSFMNLLTYLLAIAGVVFTILGMLGKGSKFATFIACACFLVSGIFFFLSISFCLPNNTASDLTNILGGNIKDVYTLGAGSIIGGILCILSALFAGYNILSSKK